MPDEETSQEPPARRFGGTLRLVLLYLVLIAAALGVYFAFYVDARVEQTAVRNFQALNAASNRLEEIIANVHQIAGNVPVGIDPQDLDEILRNIGNASAPERDAITNQWLRIDAEVQQLRAQLLDVDRRIANLGPRDGDPSAAAGPSALQRLDPKRMAGIYPALSRGQLERERQSYTSSLQAKQLDLDRLRNRLLDETCERSETYAALKTISAIAGRYLRDFRAIPAAAEFNVKPLALVTKGAEPMADGAAAADADAQPAAASSPAAARQERAPATPKTAVCEQSINTSLDNLLATRSELCLVDAASMVSTEASVRRRLVEGPAGVVVEAQDCRTFSRRSPDLTNALPPSRDTIVAVLDNYGVGVSASLASLVDSVAANVAPLFDQYLIAGADGRVLYSADSGGFRYDGVIGAPTARKTRLDFVSHVNIRELVTRTPQKATSAVTDGLAQLGLESEQPADAGDFARYGVHSRVETFRVADIQFQAFVHPFEVEGLNVTAADAAGDESAVLYMVGIIDTTALNNESIRLRLAFVADALLPLGVLFSLLAVLWLWTGGDRLMLSVRHLVLFAITGLTATILYTLFCLHLLSGSADNLLVDRALQQVNQRIHDDFDRELEARLGNLAQATAAMLQAGEARARLPGEWIQSAATDLPGPAQVRRRIEQSYYCRPDPNDVGATAAGGLLARYPAYDLAFLMDLRGVQWQCLSYRVFDTRPIDLGFRDYFKRPAQDRLWRSDTIAGPPFVMDRITSILDGTTETVLAAQPRALCALPAANCADDPGLARVASAAILGRLHALEDTVLPPHMRFAVVDNASGRTLFHSIGSRSLATNFIRETEADQGLLALIDSGHGDFVDLNYYGASVRAFAQPLAHGLPWTLITYQGHELTDTLNIIAVSATAAYMIGSLGLLALVVVLAALADRVAIWSSPAWQRVREATLSMELVRTLLPVLATITLLAIMLTTLGGLLAPAWGSPIAVATMAVVVLALLGCVVWRVRRTPDTGTSDGNAARRPAAPGPDRPAVIAVLVMALLTLAVLPTIAWYSDFRAQLSTGLGDYLRSSARQAVIDKCDRQTAIARRHHYDSTAPEPENVFRFGWTLLPQEDADLRPQPQSGEPPQCASYRDAAARLAGIDRAMAPGNNGSAADKAAVMLAVSRFSALGSDLATRSALGGPDHRNASPTAVVGALLGGFELPPGVPGRAAVQVSDVTVLALALLGGGLLLWLVVVSLSDRVLATRLSLGYLPPALPERPPRSWGLAMEQPLRACVVHRSERLWERLLGSLIGILSAQYDSLVVRVASWNGEAVKWQPHPSSPAAGEEEETEPNRARTLYVVAGLERFIVDPDAREKLLGELERLTATPSGILIWSRILPGTWLAALTERVSGDLASGTRQLAFTTRWGRVLGPFDVRRLEDGSDNLEAQFAEQVAEAERVTLSRAQYTQLYRAMLREARANPELLELAASVVRRACTAADAGNITRLALQRFRAAAASHFHTIWAASSRDERLQLLALARGGFANPTQTVTLSSLANRGLIETQGIIRLRSEAFRRFILKDLDHDSLLRWRDQGHGNVWKSIWPPIVLVVVLAAAFFVSSSPEALAPLVAILAASIGAVPVIGSLIRGVKGLQGTQGDE